MSSDLFHAATARQIGREFAGLEPGPGFDISPESVPMPAVSVDEINWQMAPAETVPSEGGDLRAATIGYRDLALAAVHGLHQLRHEHGQLEGRHERLREELRNVRHVKGPLILAASRARAEVMPRHTLPSLSGVRGVR